MVRLVAAGDDPARGRHHLAPLVAAARRHGHGGRGRPRGAPRGRRLHVPGRIRAGRPAAEVAGHRHVDGRRGRGGDRRRQGVLAKLDLAAVRARINSLNQPPRPTPRPTTRRRRTCPRRTRSASGSSCATGGCPAAVDYDPTSPSSSASTSRAPTRRCSPGFPKFLAGRRRRLARVRRPRRRREGRAGHRRRQRLRPRLQGERHRGAGWPVHTASIGLPATGANGYTSDGISTPGLRAGPPRLAAVADLDRDGDPEISVGDIEGNLHVWNSDGSPAPASRCAATPPSR